MKRTHLLGNVHVVHLPVQYRQDPQVVQQLTAHTTLGRLGEAPDIAGVAAWLASEDAGWVTGQYIEASGGSGLV